MSLDFKDVVALVKADDPELKSFRGNVTDVILWFLKNKDVVGQILGGIISWLKNKQNGVGPSTPPITPLPQLPPVAPAVPPSEDSQLVSRLRLGFLWLEDERFGGSGGEVIKKPVFDQVVGAGPAAQMLEQRMHLNCTPIDMDGNEYPGGSPIIRGLLRKDGEPAIYYRWWVDGKEASDSEEIDDPFELQSYSDDGGCTPALHLIELTEGVRTAQTVAYLPAEFNGGVALVSNPVTWRID